MKPDTIWALKVLQIPPNFVQVSNLTGGSRQKTLHGNTSGRPNATFPLRGRCHRSHARGKRWEEGAAGTPEQRGFQTWPPLPRTRDLTSPQPAAAWPCPGPAGPRYLPPAPPALPRRSSPAARASLQGRAQHRARTRSRQGWPRTAPRLGGGCGREGQRERGWERRSSVVTHRCPAEQARPPPPPSARPHGASPASRRQRLPAVSRGLSGASPPPWAPCPRGSGGDGAPRLPRIQAPLEPSAPGSRPVCARARQKHPAAAWETIFMPGFVHPNVLVGSFLA